MHQMNLSLYEEQWLISYKTKSSQTKLYQTYSKRILETIQLLLYTHIHDLGNSMNERTHFLKWEMGRDRDRVLYWPDFFSRPKHVVLSSRTHIALLPQLGWGCSTGDRWLSQSARWRSLLTYCHQLTQRPPASAYIFYNAHLLPLLLPLIYTGVFLIDGSVKV